MSSDPSTKLKMSEMISEMGTAFISVGKTPEEKRNRLTAVCSAWNMACGSPEDQQWQLEQYIDGYKRFNPATSPSDLAKLRTDMESLVARKLQLFPDDKRQIVSSRVVMVGSDYRIEVASASVK
jgi:hypothetical protein